MQPKFVEMATRKLIGCRIQTCLAENRTSELWRPFRQRAAEISSRANDHFFSIQIYEKGIGFEAFNPQTMFEKWAAVEVSHFENIPPGMEKLLISAGKYAVFILKGPPEAARQQISHLFGTWLPASEFEFDDRPQFEIMPKNWLPNDPNAEEEIWIPIKEKARKPAANE